MNHQRWKGPGPLYRLAVPLDTTPEAARMQADGLRRASASRRLGMVFEMGRLGHLLMRDGSDGMVLSQESFLVEIVRRLAEAGIVFMVVGSVASSTHGQPRFTRDVDIVIDPTPVQRDALRRRFLFNVLAPEDGWKADLIIRKDRPYSVEELGRRRMVKLGDVDVPFASPEDVILPKLEWNRLSPSETQVRDALTVAITQAGALDRVYLRKWAAELGVAAKLDEVLAETDRFLTPGPPG